MDFGLALTFQFKDPEWLRKLLMAAMVSLIPVFGWIVALGWSLQVTRLTLRQESGLPEVDLGNDLVLGLKACAINFLYYLPLVLFVSPAMILAGVSLLRSPDFSTNSGIAVVITLVCLGGLALAYFFFASLLIPAAYGRLIADDSLAAGFQIRSVLGVVRKNLPAYFLVMVGQFLCSWIASFGMVACIIGVILTSLYSLTVMGHLYGQAYRQAHGE